MNVTFLHNNIAKQKGTKPFTVNVDKQTYSYHQSLFTLGDKNTEKQRR